MSKLVEVFAKPGCSRQPRKILTFLSTTGKNNLNKIEKASEMQQPSCKSKSFGQTGFLFSRFINVMCQVSIFWYCWFTRRRFLNIKINNHFRPPLGPFFGPQTYRT
jgi:hypothetical protein